MDYGRPDLRRLLVDHAVSLSLIAVIVALAYRIFSPLFPAIIWGLLLAVICAHPYERLVSRLRGRRLLADIAFGVLLFLILLVPATFFAWQLVFYLPLLSDWLHSISAGPMLTPPAWVMELPVIGPPIASAWGVTTGDFEKDAPDVFSHLGSVASWATGRIGTFSAFVFEFTIGAVISLFILHNRFAVRAFLNRLLTRIGGAFAGSLFVRALDTTRTAFTGVIIAALAQTILATIALYFAGLPALVLFAGFTFLLALVQVGAFVVLLVADIILVFQGAYLSAILVTAWFLGVVMTVDNLIKPYFSKKGTDLPAILAFLGTIGGFLTWGLLGVFLGPVLTSVIYEMLIAWVEAEGDEEG